MTPISVELPVPRTALIGRERELAAIRQIFTRQGTRLLTVTGVGVGGKTRLALEIAGEMASDYPRRTWLVELAGVADSSLLPLTVATALGLSGSMETTVVEALITYLQLQPSLLMLDNCEHLIDACAALTEQLLAACPELRILATSREPLQIPGERQYRLPTLGSPDPGQSLSTAEIAASPAVRLFVARGQDIVPTFRLTPENAPVVAQVCARLGGIPLALELAAVRIRVLGIEQILEHLNDSFRLLTGGSRVAPTRQQTLLAALDWSYALLTEEERIVFRRLAVFAGEFALEAAESVCASSDLPATALLDLLTRLVDKSLVVAASGDSRAWYHLLEPVRQYAMTHLEASGEIAETRTRHGLAYLDLAERAEIELRGPRQDVWLSNLEREQGNLRAALEWTERQDNASLGLRMATALVPFWETHGHLIEGLRWLREALTTTHAPTLLRARALAGAGRLAFLYDHTLLSRYAEAEALLTESLVIARELDDNHAIAAALADLGMIHRLQCDFARSADCLEDALVRFRELHDDPGIALVLLNLGSTVEEMHDIVRAHDILSESLERYRALGDLRSIAIAQVLLGHVFLSLGQFQEAVRSIVEATTAHARLGDRWFVTFDLMALAEVLLRQERAHDATRLLGAAEAMREKLGSPVGGVTFKDLVARIATLRSETWFQAAWDEGYALNFADVMQAVRAALQESPPGRRATLSVDPQASVLTRRQRQVAVLLAQGYTDQQIADELFVSVGTVGVHVHAILQKLGLRSRTQVAAYLVAAEAHTTT